MSRVSETTPRITTRTLIPRRHDQAQFLREYKLVVVGGGGMCFSGRNVKRSTYNRLKVSESPA